MSLAILAAAVAVGAVALGMGAALVMAAREYALRLRLRRIDTRAARVLDVGQAVTWPSMRENAGKIAELKNGKTRKMQADDKRMINTAKNH